MEQNRRKNIFIRKPDWLRVGRYGGEYYNEIKRLLHGANLNSVCESANCPNRGECFNNKTATFLLMGNVCTRTCTFCNITAGRVAPLDPEEPRRVAETVRQMGLRYSVVTSVNRDDLPDGGAAHIAKSIREIKRLNHACAVEVLIPDFRGNPLALEKILAASPEVLNHNLETVPRLYPTVRPQANYQHSLLLLKRARQWSDAHTNNFRIKTGIMVGLGEKIDEVVALMQDAAAIGVEILTIGQYLQPTAAHHPIAKYYPPAEFRALAVKGEALGIDWVEAGPLVRSSYHAREQSESLAHKDDPMVSSAGVC